MKMEEADDRVLVAGVRRHLHDAMGQLSLAVMQLGLSAEEQPLDPELRKSLEESLDACQGAAASLREIWRLIGTPPAAGGPAT